MSNDINKKPVFNRQGDNKVASVGFIHTHVFPTEAWQCLSLYVQSTSHRLTTLIQYHVLCIESNFFKY